MRVWASRLPGGVVVRHLHPSCIQGGGRGGGGEGEGRSRCASLAELPQRAGRLGSRTRHQYKMGHWLDCLDRYSQSAVVQLRAGG